MYEGKWRHSQDHGCPPKVWRGNSSSSKLRASPFRADKRPGFGRRRWHLKAGAPFPPADIRRWSAGYLSVSMIDLKSLAGDVVAIPRKWKARDVAFDQE